MSDRPSNEEVMMECLADLNSLVSCFVQKKKPDDFPNWANIECEIKSRCRDIIDLVCEKYRDKDNPFWLHKKENRAYKDRLFKEICNVYGFEEVEQRVDGVYCEGCMKPCKREKMYKDNITTLCKFHVIEWYKHLFCDIEF